VVDVPKMALAQSGGDYPATNERPSMVMLPASFPGGMVPVRPTDQAFGRLLDFVTTSGQEPAKPDTDKLQTTPEKNSNVPANNPLDLSGQLGRQVEELDVGQPAEKQTDQKSSQPPRKEIIETSGRIEVIRQRYPDGQVQIEREVTQDTVGNYFNHGSWRLYGPTGQTLSEGMFQYGLMEGPWIRWHPAAPAGIFTLKPFNLFRGPYMSMTTFAEGKLDGVWSIADTNQRKIMEIAYRQGKRHGLSAWYYPSSKKMREQYFIDGVLEGPLVEWDEKGVETRREEYVKGRKVIAETSYFRPKQKKSESFFLDAQLELSEEDNWWDATPAAYQEIGTKTQNGPANTWYENGQPQMQGQFDSGKRTGSWNWWHANGQKQSSGTFNADEKVGLWIWWHPNGMKAVEGNYEHDRPIGVWNWWDDQGRLSGTQPFVDDPDQQPTTTAPKIETPAANPTPTTLDPPLSDNDAEEFELIEQELSTPHSPPKSPNGN
jgi:antitoxin component YwqK of YwqJK toxin-antitoxin module